MRNLIQTELLKTSKTPIFKGMFIIGLLPILLSYLISIGGEVLSIQGDVSVVNYMLGMINSVFLGLGITVVLFILLINSFISEEIQSEVLTYQVVGKNKKTQIVNSKIITTNILLIIYLITLSISTHIGQRLFIITTPETFSIIQLLIYMLSALSYTIFLLNITALLSFNHQKNKVFGIVFITHIIVMNIAKIKILGYILPGGLYFGNYDESLTNLQTALISIFQIIIMILIYFAYYNKTKKRLQQKEV